ncbi:hypothetical protein LCGC14_2092940 [marine sediment metagenome]|uniref:Uncharacterized protein n=1 Tax=marine sediment metagenome TaxID=412755 RepID=A0A0F9GQ87_9ZZZZ
MAQQSRNLTNLLGIRGFTARPGDKFPLFDERRRLFDQFNLGSDLGSFIGSPKQNTALEQSLNRAENTIGVPISPTNATNFIGIANKLPRDAAGASPLFATNVPGLPVSSTGVIPMQRPLQSQVTQGLGFTPRETPTIFAPRIPTPQPPVAPTPTPTTPTALAAPVVPPLVAPKAEVQETFTQVNIPSSASEEDLAARVFSSPEFQLERDRIEASATSEIAKSRAKIDFLERQFQVDKDSLERKFSARGLFQSGMRATQARALAENLAASKLGVDRDLASQLIDTNLDLREAILDAVADVAKDAQQNRKDAIAQLNKVGLAVIGDQIVPTLAAETAAETKKRLERGEVRAERRLGLAEEAAIRAGRAKEPLTTTQKATVMSAINFYGDTLSEVISQGGSPRDAVNAVSQIAFASGVTLDVITQNALFEEAQRFVQQQIPFGIETPSEININLRTSPEVEDSFFGQTFGVGIPFPR